MHDYYNLRYYGKEIINLTRMENTILDLLLINKNRIVKYKELQQLIYDFKYVFDDNEVTRKSIITHISRLNNKLKNEFQIINKRGVGYIIK